MWGWRRARYSFELPEGASASPLIVQSYWEVQRFACRPDGAGGLVGERGSLWGNLTAFDLRRLRCQLAVTVVERRMNCSLLMDTSFQFVSKWNDAELALELLMFRRTLLGLPAPAALDQFRSESRAATGKLVFSATFFGRSLPPRWKELLQELAAPFQVPVVEHASRAAE
jgi:hypothetical protein